MDTVTAMVMDTVTITENMENRKKKIAIVWANPYNKNLGVGALAYSSLALLNDVIEDSGLGAELSFFGGNTNVPDAMTINGKTIRFGNFHSIDFYHWKGLIKRFVFFKKFQTKKLNEFDYVFDIAEGDSFTDIYGAERFWRILNSKIFFAKQNKPQILLPQTIGPFKNPAHEKAAFDTMRELELVISRDKSSYEYTSRFLPQEKIFESIDVAFYMPFEKQKFDNGKINVGINVSGLLWNGGYTKKNQFGMKTDYKKLILETLQYFSEMENVQVHLVPHVIPDQLSQAVEDDYAVSEEIKKEYPNVVIAPRFASPIEAKSYISGMDFFTGARMHACIAAFSTGVAVYPMAYSRKFNGLFGETLQYEWMGDCVNEDESHVFLHLKEAFEKRDVLKKQIDKTLDSVVKPRLNTLKKLLSEKLLK